MRIGRFLTLAGVIVVIGSAGSPAAIAGGVGALGPQAPLQSTLTGISPTQGPAGTQITISGVGLSNTSAVTVAGMPASFTVLSGAEVVATVPDSSPTQGPVQLTIGKSTLTSAQNFAITAAGPQTPVVLIVLENKTYNQIVGNKNAPFINSVMIANGALETNYFAIVPGSLHNYVAMTAGVTQNTFPVPDLMGALGYGTGWREFEESMPSTCFLGKYSQEKVPGTSTPLYSWQHNPAVRFNNVKLTDLCDDNVVPLDETFDPEQLPQFSLVVPNQCNDMHSASPQKQCPMWNGQTNTAPNAIRMSDNWLSQFVPQVADDATVILTWDEGDRTTEHIVTVEYGVGVTPGTDGTLYNHYSLEAGLYSYFGLGAAPGGGATATPLPIGATGGPQCDHPALVAEGLKESGGMGTSPAYGGDVPASAAGGARRCL